MMHEINVILVLKAVLINFIFTLLKVWDAGYPPYGRRVFCSKRAGKRQKRHCWNCMQEFACKSLVAKIICLAISSLILCKNEWNFFAKHLGGFIKWQIYVKKYFHNYNALWALKGWEFLRGTIFATPRPLAEKWFYGPVHRTMIICRTVFPSPCKFCFCYIMQKFIFHEIVILQRILKASHQ